MAITFFEFFKSLRQAKYDTLREFCQKNGYDSGNISKLERGLFSPPDDPKKLAKLAQAVGLKSGDANWTRFMDLARAAIGSFSVKNITDDAVLGKLPMLFRAVDRADLTEEELQKAIDVLKGAWTAEKGDLEKGKGK